MRYRHLNTALQHEDPLTKCEPAHQNAYNLPEYPPIYIFITSKPSIPEYLSSSEIHTSYLKKYCFLKSLRAFLCMWHIFLPLPDTVDWKSNLSHNDQLLQFVDHLSLSPTALGKHEHPCVPVVNSIREPDQVTSIQAKEWGLLDQALLLMATNVLHMFSVFLQNAESSSRPWISTLSHLAPISFPTDSLKWPLSLAACCPTHLLLAAGYNWGLSWRLAR